MTEQLRISPLSDHVINQIAAGEVIERPLSIVKELVENSLDAGASAIEIRIEAGGANLIAVRDDGRGIESDDLTLALQRHCTSKLTSAEQLQEISSLGFRGEALASIAAVSKLSLSSRTAGCTFASEICCNYGELSKARPAASYPVGTVVKVESLFENTPARRKFLRQARTENLQISQLLRHMAFSHDGVSFSFLADGKKVLNVAASRGPKTVHRRLRELFGKEFSERALRLERSEQGLSVKGWVGPFDTHRPRADIQFLSVNHRVVKDRTLVHAIRLAYDGKIPEGRYPSYALDIDIASEEVDVNVHPTKTEVRFAEPRQIHDQVYSFITHTLATNPTLLGSALGQPPKAGEPSPYGEPDTRRTTVPEVAESRYQSKNYSKASVRGSGRNSGGVFGDRKLSENNFVGLFFNRYALLTKPTRQSFGEELSVGEQPIFIDLVALLAAVFHSRIINDARTRPLIVPESIASDAVFSEKKLEEYKECGLIITALGPKQLVVREVPLVLLPVDYQKFSSALAAGAATGNNDVAVDIARAAASAVLVPADSKAQQRWFAQVAEHMQSAGLNEREFYVERSEEQWLKFFGE